jgi:outer membrane protein OmpA-like peptidoglycan-associated protein/ABC-type nitrate/sulfonate/bicarbonate transport system substrate-binding protein
MSEETKLLRKLLYGASALGVVAWVWYNTVHGASPPARPSQPQSLATALATQQKFTLAISEWPGHMPFVVGNGGLRTATGSPAHAQGLDLEIVFIEDAAKKNRALQEGAVDFLWQTVDELPIALPGYKKAGIDVRAFLQIDWSRGGDACVASADVTKVEDVHGRKSAMLMFSPDHTVFEFMIRNSRLTAAQIKRVQADTLFSLDDFTYGRVLFAQGKVDVACLWEPDVSLALKSRRGAHVLFSTADASELVADVVLARSDLLEQRPEIARKLAQTWFAGVAKAEADRPSAAKLISSVAPRFRDELGYAGTLAAFDWVKWTQLGENVRMFGLDGAEPAFDRVFEQADGIWTKYPQSGITERFVPARLRDDRIVRALFDAGGRQSTAETPRYEPKLAQSGAALFTKPLSLNYGFNRAELDATAMQVLHEQVLPQLQMARAMHIRVEGNTDDVGSTDTNRAVSERRAREVAEFFFRRGIARERVSFKGNGASAPVASNATPTGRAANRRTDIVFVRTSPRL